MSPHFSFQSAPAHLVRRLHQQAVALFSEEAQDYGLTPVQFAILNALMQSPGQDQVSLAAQVAFDPATSGSVLGRLEAKGLIRRRADEHDRRRKRLWVTPKGERLAHQLEVVAARVQQRLLAPLSPSERKQFIGLLDKLLAQPLAQPLA